MSPKLAREEPRKGPQTQDNYYIWAPQGLGIEVHLHWDVMDLLQAEVRRGYGMLRKRGEEIGGLLIGSQVLGWPTIFRVEDFELVRCGYGSGLSYLLNGEEKTAFKNACERHKPGPDVQGYAIGYVRSQIRDGMSLSAEDRELMDGCFSEPPQLALLVKPSGDKPSVGGFFVREDGVFPEATPLEFPFSRWELTGKEPTPKRMIPGRRRTPVEMVNVAPTVEMVNATPTVPLTAEPLAVHPLTTDPLISAQAPAGEVAQHAVELPLENHYAAEQAEQGLENHSERGSTEVVEERPSAAASDEPPTVSEAPVDLAATAGIEEPPPVAETPVDLAAATGIEEPPSVAEAPVVPAETSIEAPVALFEPLPASEPAAEEHRQDFTGHVAAGVAPEVASEVTSEVASEAAPEEAKPEVTKPEVTKSGAAQEAKSEEAKPEVAGEARLSHEPPLERRPEQHQEQHPEPRPEQQREPRSEQQREPRPEQQRPPEGFKEIFERLKAEQPPARFSSVGGSSDQPGSRKLSSAELSLAQLSSAQLSSAPLSSVQPISAQLSSAQLSSVQPSPIPRGAEFGELERFGPGEVDFHGAMEPPPYPEPSGLRVGWAGMLLAGLALLVGLVVGFQVALSWSRKAPVAVPHGDSLSLSVTKDGQNLLVRWNTDSNLVRTADHGALEIEDSGLTKIVPLDRANILNGGAAVQRASSSVRFRLTISSPGRGAASESVDWRE